MKSNRCIAAILFLACSFFAKAQQIHFVYLQTENGQPFYVKMENKVTSSSSVGYLILPKIPDGDYKLTVGFPKKEFPEENFEIAINKKSQGYLLKNFGEQGWGLFDLQSFAVLKGKNTNTEASTAKKLQDDPFSKMLANVVNDSSILQQNEPLKEAVPIASKIDSSFSKTEPDIAKIGSPANKPEAFMTTDDSLIAKVDSTIANVDSNSITVAEKTQPLSLSPATRLLRKKNKDGMEMIYVDRNQNTNDTIRIFIPSEKTIKKSDSVDTGFVHNENGLIISPGDTVSIAIEKPTSQIKSDTTLFVSSEKENMVEKKDSAIARENDVKKQPEINLQDSVSETVNKTETIKKDEMIVLPKVVQSSTTNSDCKAFANDEDFLRLRKKMASENSSENMIRIAKKYFHSKCFSTEQIKNLSFLFLKDEGKYQFFDAAYAFTSNSDQYHILQSQLIDSYYISRFKAMIHK